MDAGTLQRRRVCVQHTRFVRESFFYSWSELSLAPVDWFRFGLVAQRTKACQTDLDTQRGFLVGFTYQKMDFTTYLFNPDASRPTVVLAVRLSF